MILFQVGVELSNIGTEGLDRPRGRDKAVHPHGTVVPRPKVPGPTGQRHGADGAPNGPDAPVSGKPRYRVVVG